MEIKSNSNLNAQQRMQFQNQIESMRVENEEEKQNLIKGFDSKLAQEQQNLKNEKRRELESQKNDYEVKLKEQSQKYEKLKNSIVEDHQKEVEGLKRIYNNNITKLQEQHSQMLRRQKEDITDEVDVAVFNEKTKMDNLLSNRLKNVSNDYEKNMQRDREVFELQKENAQNKYQNTIHKITSKTRLNDAETNRKLNEVVEDNKQQRHELINDYEEIIKEQKGYPG